MKLNPSIAELKGKMPAKSFKTSIEFLLSSVPLSQTRSLKLLKKQNVGCFYYYTKLFTPKNQFQSNNLPEDKAAGDGYVSDYSNYQRTAFSIQCTFVKRLQTFRVFFFSLIFLSSSVPLLFFFLEIEKKLKSSITALPQKEKRAQKRHSQLLR